MSGSEVGVQRLLVPPQLRTLEGADGRRASYLELFFDLVFVVAIVLVVMYKLWTAQRSPRMSVG
jgi:low temperature requirement protein LtrA